MTTIPDTLVRRAYLLTFLTGAAGLVDELVWQRYLARLLGHDAPATATVLGVFLGGLALGYLLCGRLTLRVGNHLRLYAALEAVIGIWALLFPWLFRGVELATASWSFASPWWLALQGTLAGALLMGLPTLCMGGTVPVLTRGLTATLDDATPVHARVYGWNTAGAFAGTLAAGFVLVEWLGLPGTLRVSALVNLLAAAVFWSVARRQGDLPGPRAPETRLSVQAETAFPRTAVGSLYAIALLSGFCTMTVESVLIRVTQLSIGSSSYAFTLVVAAFVLCIAGGAFWVGRRKRIERATLFRNQSLACLALLALFFSLDGWPYYAHVVRIAMPSTNAGFVGFHAAVLGLLLVALAVPVGCLGATLPLAFHASKRELDRIGAGAGALFAWNAAGNLCGGLLGGFLLYQLVGNGEVYLLGAGACGLTALLAAPGLAPRGRAWAVVPSVALLLTAWLFPFDPTRFAVGTFRLREPLTFSGQGAATFYDKYYESRSMLAYRDAPEGTFAVIENLFPDEALTWHFPGLMGSLAGRFRFEHGSARPRTILINGKADSSTYYDRLTLKTLAHLPALLTERLDHVLLIGLGTGVSAAELTLYPELRSLDVVEISPTVVEFLPFFEPWTRDLTRDPRVRIRVADGFRAVRHGRPRWDVILCEPSNPWTTGVDQLYTADFYRLVRSRLADDGLFVQWVQRYATNPTIAGLAVQTLRAELPYLRAFRAEGDELVLARRTPWTDEAITRARQRLAALPAVAESLGVLGLDGVDDLLELEDPAFFRCIEDSEPTAAETLDRPRLHYWSGRAFFRGQSLAEACPE